MHADARTIWGDAFAGYAREPVLDGGDLQWRPAADASLDPTVLTGVARPFDREGGLRLLTGNLGRAIIKVSAVKPEHRRVEAPAVVLESQQALADRFAAGELERDCVLVVRFQGPRANGMPELHRLTPLVSSLQDKGFAVALVTDGRMSGASGKIPAAIHVSPEAAAGGPLARLRDGDLITVDADAGLLQCHVDAQELASRPAAPAPAEGDSGIGRELFALFRRAVSTPEEGACVLFPD
jgi:phosphogluconate dehydratase